MSSLADRFPGVRGKLLEHADLSPFTWFRVGGPADLLFLPQDVEDLQVFLKTLPASTPITVLGAASNVIVRGGGVEGVVIRLTPAFGRIEIDGSQVTAGAAALDLKVAQAAGKAGVAGLEFFSGVPGRLAGP